LLRIPMLALAGATGPDMLNNSLVARRFSSMTRSTTLLTNRFRHLAAGRRQLHENVPVLRRFLQNVGHSSLRLAALIE
jgi:hypothetical protein